MVPKMKHLNAARSQTWEQAERDGAYVADAVMWHKPQHPAVRHTCTAAVSEAQIEGQTSPPTPHLSQLLMRPKDTQAHTHTRPRLQISWLGRYQQQTSFPSNERRPGDSGSTGAI